MGYELRSNVQYRELVFSCTCGVNTPIDQEKSLDLSIMETIYTWLYQHFQHLQQRGEVSTLHCQQLQYLHLFPAKVQPFHHSRQYKPEEAMK